MAVALAATRIAHEDNPVMYEERSRKRYHRQCNEDRGVSFGAISVMLSANGHVGGGTESWMDVRGL